MFSCTPFSHHADDPISQGPAGMPPPFSFFFFRRRRRSNISSSHGGILIVRGPFPRDAMHEVSHYAASTTSPVLVPKINLESNYHLRLKKFRKPLPDKIPV